MPELEEDDVTGICPPAMNSAIVGRTMWSCSSALSGGGKVSTSVQTEEEVGAAISEDNLKSFYREAICLVRCVGCFEIPANPEYKISRCCNTVFCKGCLRHWDTQQLLERGYTTCPHCRYRRVVVHSI